MDLIVKQILKSQILSEFLLYSNFTLQEFGEVLEELVKEIKEVIS